MSPSSWWVGSGDLVPVHQFQTSSHSHPCYTRANKRLFLLPPQPCTQLSSARSLKLWVQWEPSTPTVLGTLYTPLLRETAVLVTLSLYTPGKALGILGSSLHDHHHNPLPMATVAIDLWCHPLQFCWVSLLISRLSALAVTIGSVVSSLSTPRPLGDFWGIVLYCDL